MPDSGHSDLGQIHHIAYLVDEIQAATRRLYEQFGAGPFFFLEEVPVIDVTSRGEPAEFKHASAFGVCNGLPVELMVIANIAPARADERFAAANKPHLHHVAYAVPPDTLHAIRAELEANGLPEYLSAHFGDDIDFSYHDAGRTFGHDLELHADSEGLRGFFAMVRQAADGWDGSDLLRPALG